MACKPDPKLAHDIRNFAGLMADLASGRSHIPTEKGQVPKVKGGAWALRGMWFHGPEEPDNHIEYEFSCRKRTPLHDYGHGTCSSIEIARKGPGRAKLGLKEKASVGNIHGLMDQLSRDLAKLYGCELSPTSGFEGAPHRSRRKR
jgi:hypothetical protein